MAWGGQGREIKHWSKTKESQVGQHYQPRLSKSGTKLRIECAIHLSSYTK